MAEDDAFVRTAMVDILSDDGFDVVEASHVDEAFDILNVQASGVHLLFTDIHMPGAMDGLDLAHHAARHWPWIRLLVTSGRRRPDASAMPPGCRFAPKPYDHAHILRQIREMIDQA